MVSIAKMIGVWAAYSALLYNLLWLYFDHGLCHVSDEETLKKNKGKIAACLGMIVSVVPIIRTIVAIGIALSIGESKRGQRLR